MGCGCFLRTFFNTSFLPSLSSCPSTITIVTRTRRVVARIVLVHSVSGAWLRASRQRAPIMMTGARKPWQPAVQPPSHQLEGSISEGGEGGRQGGFRFSAQTWLFHIPVLSSPPDRGGSNTGMVVTKIAPWCWSKVDSTTHGHFGQVRASQPVVLQTHPG